MPHRSAHTNPLLGGRYTAGDAACHVSGRSPRAQLPRLGRAAGFRHAPLRQHWHSPKWGSWSCEALFCAYQTYEWPFTCVLPGDTAPRSGRSYQDTVAVLNELKQQLRDSVASNDATRFLAATVAVLQWGQVRQIEPQLRVRGDDVLPQLTAAARLLDPAVADLRCLSDVRPMTSGFSKIYSLLIDGFPIYDSRVACGIASLVRLFCEETGRTEVPASLAFGIPPSQGRVKRNPSCGPFVFRGIWSSSARRYAESNVMAAWLLDALSEAPPFFELGAERQRAVQSAMFMIGYAPLTRSVLTSPPIASDRRRPGAHLRAVLRGWVGKFKGDPFADASG